MNRNSKKGITLVELIVALTLTSIFAVLCVMLINPIERTYRSTLKLARAQLLADTIVDSVRKECDDVKHDEKMSVWIGNLGSSDDADLLDKGPEIKTTNGKGDVLVFQRNSNYTEAIYSNAEISNTNFTNVENNPLTPSNTAHSINTLDNDIKEANLKSGIVHFGYYQAKEDDRGIFPIKSYDYTNPVLASTYGNFTVDLKFENLTFSKSDKYPVYVLCKVNVLEKGTTVYTRSAVISFAANGSGNGSYTPTTSPSKKDVEIKIVWDDHNNTANRPADGVTIELWNASKTKRLGIHIVSDVKSDKPQRFKFSNINTSEGLAVVQIFNTSSSGYQTTINKKANGFVITNKGSAVTLLAGPDLNSILHKNDVLHVVFGMESDIRTKVALPTSYSKASIAGNSLTEDYKLYWVNTSKTIYIVSDDGMFIAHPNCSQMFDGCKNLVSITWNDGAGDFVIDTSNTTNMASMFKGCLQMTQFNLKNLVQDKCTSIASMFEGCTHGSELNNMSSWDTSAVLDMSRMFFNYGVYHDDSSDGSIDVSTFNFSACQNMKQMFMNDKNDEKSLAEIKFPASTKTNLLNMNNVTSMEQLFFGNAKLAKITNFNCMDCQKLTNVNKMFDGCKALTELNLQYFIMPNCDIEDQYQQGKQFHAFWECDNLTEINLDGWDISSETNLRDFFGYMPKLKRVSLIDCKTPKLQSAEGMFYHCFALEEVYMPGFVGEKCTTIRSIFNQCRMINEWDISGWKTSNVKYMRDAFSETNATSATALKLDLSTWDFNSVIDITSFCYMSGFSEIKFKPHGEDNPLDFNKVTSIRRMFAESKRLTRIENFNHASFASYIKNYEKKLDEHGNQQKEYGSEHIFQNCSSLTSIDISGLKLPKCDSMKNWFNGCSSLTKAVLNDVDLSTCTTFDTVFASCTALNRIEMNRVDFSNATTLAFISAPTNLKELYMANALLPKISSLSAWFSKKNIEYVDLSDVELNACTNTSSMFYYCHKLKTVRMNNFKTPVNTTCESMFENCYSIKVFEAANWDTGNVNSMKKMFFKSCYYDGNYCKSYDKVTIDLSSFDFTNVTTCESMFHCDNPGDNVNRDCIETVRFPSSASDGDPYAAKCTSFYNMFKFRKGMSNIENLGEFRVNVEVLKDISYIFSNTGVITLDVSGLNLTGSTASAKNMFEACDNLTKIYVAPGTDWSSENFSTYATMFNNSKKIVGGNNTTYNAAIVDKRYARIDKDGYPGYFTDINDKPA